MRDFIMQGFYVMDKKWLLYCDESGLQKACDALQLLPCELELGRGLHHCASIAQTQNAERLNSEIIYDRDFDYDYFGFKTLERSYLLRINGQVVERPQHMIMRVAVGIHKVRRSSQHDVNIVKASCFCHSVVGPHGLSNHISTLPR